MNLENFDIKTRFIKDIELFLKEYSLREEIFRGTTSRGNTRRVVSLGKEKIGDSEASLILSEYWQPADPKYKSNEIIAFLNSDLRQVLPSEKSSYVNNPDDGFIFYLSTTRCYSRDVPTHWNGISSGAKIKARDCYEWLRICGEDADRLLSLVGM